MKAITGKTQYRVIYGDTDQMGVVYYGSYGRLYEMGRSEMIRELGFPYAELEEMGVVMPVYSVEARYRKVISYDELITIETTVNELPTAKMKFHHRIYKEDGTLAHEATVVLVFMDMQTKKLVRAPDVLLNVIK
ncbi:MAG: acyl-CoA thioesterase [Bacteroidetes bacterium]|nr:acyl-CoA thioesterase [Bacteroidota bacterium]